MNSYNIRVEEDYFRIEAVDEDDAKDQAIEHYIRCYAHEWGIEICDVEEDI